VPYCSQSTTEDNIISVEHDRLTRSDPSLGLTPHELTLIVEHGSRGLAMSAGLSQDPTYDLSAHPTMVDK